MNNYQEILELAAKAAGIFVTAETWPYSKEDITPEDLETYFDPDDLSITGTEIIYSFSGELSGSGSKTWKPFTDNYDAFELQCKLKIMVDYIDKPKSYMCGNVVAVLNGCSFYEKMDQDIEQATRRAIVRAAASVMQR